MRVMLVNTAPHADPDHPRNEYAVFRRLAARSRAHALTDRAADADLVLFCGALANPRWPVEIWAHPVYRARRSACARFGTEDDVFPWFPGLYASLPAALSSATFRGAPYPHVAEYADAAARPGAPDGCSDPPRYLYSFVGAFDTHPLRRQMAGWADARACVEDTSRHPGRGYGQPADTYRAYRSRYAQVLADSRFVLCPRGSGASSIRIFEALRAARVPVIVSDDWTPPDGPDWNACALRVREADLPRLPEIVRAAEPRFGDLARSAADAWRRFYAADALFDAVAAVAAACTAAAGARPPWRHRLRISLAKRQWRRGWLYPVTSRLRRLRESRRGGPAVCA